MGGVGAAAGPLIGGLITTAISWRAAFVFQALIVAVIVYLSRSIVDPVAPDPTRPFDTLGAVLSAAGLVLVVMGVLSADNNLVLMAVLLAVGALVLGLFFVHIRARERNGEEPLLSTALFRNRTSNLGLVTQNVQWLLLMGTAFVVSAYLQVVRGYNAIQTGVIFTAATGGILLSSLAAERLAKKHAQRTLIIAGFVTTIAGVVVLLALVKGSPERLGLRARTPAHRSRGRSDADPVRQRRAVRLSRSATGRNIGLVALHLQSRLVPGHGSRRDHPRLQPHKRFVRRRDDRPGTHRDHRARRRNAPPAQRVRHA